MILACSSVILIS